MPTHNAPPAKSHNTLKAAQPTRKIFDPWNTSSKGHQHAENRLSGSTAWRDLRTIKLAGQLSDIEGRGGAGVKNPLFGGETADEDADLQAGQERLPVGWKGPREERDRAENGFGFAEPPRKRRRTGPEEMTAAEAPKSRAEDVLNDRKHNHISRNPPVKDAAVAKEPEEVSLDGDDGEDAVDSRKKKSKNIFKNLTFYVNGSTAPLISDHKLRQLLIANGGNLALGLARRSVTHVILGTPNGGAHHSTDGTGRDKGAGGGLAGGKIQKEISTRKISGPRFVSVAWVLECLELGARVPEAGFAPGVVGLAGRGQMSVREMMMGGRAGRSVKKPG